MPKKLDFEKLFLYKQKLEITKGGETVGKVYQRLLNDADTEFARSQALRKSGEFRAALRDETSDEYFSFVSPLLDLTADEMIANILVQEMTTRRERLQYEIPPVIPPKPPADASLVKQEKYQKEVDEIEEMWYKTINERLEQELEQRREELREKEPDDLRVLLKRTLVDRLCSLRMINVFQTYSAYLGTFSDASCQEPYFETYEEFETLPTEVLEQLVDGYFSLGINRDEVKK